MSHRVKTFEPNYKFAAMLALAYATVIATILAYNEGTESFLWAFIFVAILAGVVEMFSLVKVTVYEEKVFLKYYLPFFSKTIKFDSIAEVKEYKSTRLFWSGLVFVDKNGSRRLVKKSYVVDYDKLYQLFKERNYLQGESILADSII